MVLNNIKSQILLKLGIKMILLTRKILENIGFNHMN
jgi:hypothetical protein